MIIQDIRRIVKNDSRIINKLHRRIFLDNITLTECKVMGDTWGIGYLMGDVPVGASCSGCMIDRLDCMNTSHNKFPL